MVRQLRWMKVIGLGNNQKILLVIGGGAGIGREIAVRSLQEGFRVAIADINVEAMNEMKAQYQSEGDIFTYKVDVSSWDSTKKMMDEVEKTAGPVHTLVCSAGITKDLPLEEVDWNLWKKTMEINLHGLFYSVKAAAPMMIKKGNGNIIIIGSGSAVTGSGGGIQYYASKGGAFGLMRALVKELGDYGINVNVLAPRVIESQMLDILYPTEEAREQLRRKIPIGRFGTPGDLASITAFLSSDDASYIHGQIIVMDGGRTYNVN